MFKDRKKTTLGVIHCSATPPSMDIGVSEIREWHIDNRWIDIGYHIVIRRNGHIEFGRPLSSVGAHAYMHNSYTVGVCMVGGVDAKKVPENNFTKAQWKSLELVMECLNHIYMGLDWTGHRNLKHNTARACPSFDVHDWMMTKKPPTFSEEEFNGLLDKMTNSFMPDTIPPTIRKGSRGEDVKILQRLLELTLVDGIFGPMTLKAVKTYQRNEGLGVDGIVGPKTWSKLLNV